MDPLAHTTTARTPSPRDILNNDRPLPPIPPSEHNATLGNISSATPRKPVDILDEGETSAVNRQYAEEGYGMIQKHKSREESSTHGSAFEPGSSGSLYGESRDISNTAHHHQTEVPSRSRRSHSAASASGAGTNNSIGKGNSELRESLPRGDSGDSDRGIAFRKDENIGITPQGFSIHTSTVQAQRTRNIDRSGSSRNPSASGRESINLFATPEAPTSTENTSALLQTSSSSSQRVLATDTENLVPRWQPDAEVTFCPICRTQFSFFIRKHHCRKCGRVVCNSCSPHRITIPYQYIVQPPMDGGSLGLYATSARPSIDPARAGSSAVVTSLGGGERVRLCNPCVPDPNVAPPQASQRPEPQRQHSQQSHHGHARSVSTAAVPHYQSETSAQADVEHYLRNFTPRHSQPSILGPRSHHTSLSENPPRGSSYTARVERSLRPDAMDSRSRSSTVGSSRGSNYMDNVLPNPSPRLSHNHYRSTATSETHSRPLPRPPRAERERRRVIPEEDECWICHQELPSRTLPNYEDLRSAHIQSCLDAAIMRHAPSPPPTSAPLPRAGPSGSSSLTAPSSSTPPNISIPTPSASLSTPQARTAARERAHAAVVLGTSSTQTPPAARRTGVFPYLATEKDCVDDAECTICLEEFEVGVEMGRLECFCRFHRKCIREWFVGRPGQCPVHWEGGGY